jgi:hypothetical protein
VRARLMPVIVVATGCVIAVSGAAEDRTAPRGHAAASIQTVVSNPITHLSQFADQTPDGSHLIELYKAARTVADVEAANTRVKDQVIASAVRRLRTCEAACGQDDRVRKRGRLPP